MKSHNVNNLLDDRDQSGLAGRAGKALMVMAAMTAMTAATSGAAFSAELDSKAIIDAIVKKHEVKPPTQVIVENKSDFGLEYALQDDMETHVATSHRAVVNAPLMIETDIIMFTIERLPMSDSDKGAPDRAACVDAIADQLSDDATNGTLAEDQFYLAGQFLNYNLVKIGNDYVFKSPYKNRPQWTCAPDSLSVLFVPGVKEE